MSISKKDRVALEKLPKSDKAGRAKILAKYSLKQILSTRKKTIVWKNPRGNYTAAEKKSIKRHTCKALKRSGAAVRKFAATVKRVRRNPVITYDYRAKRSTYSAPRRYIIEALVRGGRSDMQLKYLFWNGQSFVTDRRMAETFSSSASAADKARKLLPLCASKIHSLRPVPA
jgi:hypothetical protein